MQILLTSCWRTVPITIKADNDDTTPLYIAAQNGHTDIVDALLATGADINKATNDSVTPLAIAAYKGHEPVVKLLLTQNANPFMRWQIMESPPMLPKPVLFANYY